MLIANTPRRSPSADDVLPNPATRRCKRRTDACLCAAERRGKDQSTSCQGADWPRRRESAPGRSRVLQVTELAMETSPCERRHGHLVLFSPSATRRSCPGAVTKCFACSALLFWYLRGWFSCNQAAVSQISAVRQPEITCTFSESN